MSKLFISCIGAALVCMSFSAFSNESLDPEGKIFIQRAKGDTVHCGPIAAIMARRFADPTYKPKRVFSEITNARGLVNDFMGLEKDADFSRWWKIRDIETYLKFSGVQFKSARVTKGRNAENQIIDLLDRQRLLLVNVNMNHIPKGETANKPYSTFYVPGGWGHFLAIVGYKYKKDELYLEVHDSYNASGKNRLFQAKYIVGSMNAYAANFVHIKKGV